MPDPHLDLGTHTSDHTKATLNPWPCEAKIPEGCRDHGGTEQRKNLRLGLRMGFQESEDKSQNFKILGTQSSHRGAVETNLTSIHEDTGWISGLARWVKDPAWP